MAPGRRHDGPGPQRRVHRRRVLRLGGRLRAGARRRPRVVRRGGRRRRPLRRPHHQAPRRVRPLAERARQRRRGRLRHRPGPGGRVRGRLPGGGPEGRLLPVPVGLAPPGLPGLPGRGPALPAHRLSPAGARGVGPVPGGPLRAGPRAAHRLRGDQRAVVRRRLGAQRRRVAGRRARGPDPRAAAGHPAQRAAAIGRRLHDPGAVRPRHRARGPVGDLSHHERELGLRP